MVVGVARWLRHAFFVVAATLVFASSGPPAIADEPVIVSQSTTPGFAGKWEGNYQCYQYASLTLYISETAPAKFDIEARFGPTPANTEMPRGSFRLSGAINRKGELVMTPVAWIDQPPGFEMIGFVASLTNESLIQGKVSHPSCQEFHVRRKGNVPLPAAMETAISVVADSGFETEYMADTYCGNARFKIDIKPKLRNGRWYGTLAYHPFDGAREGPLDYSNRLIGHAETADRIVFEPDYSAFDMVLLKKGEGQRAGLIFTRTSAGWQGQDLNPKCPGAVLTKKAADTFVAPDGQPLQGLAWIGKVPSDRIGGLSLWEFSRFQTGNVLNAADQAPGLAWAPIEQTNGWLGIAACRMADCANDPSRRVFFLTNRNASSAWMDMVQMSILFVSQVSPTETQICNQNSDDQSWYCYRTQAAMPVGGTLENLRVWAETRRAQEAQAWRSAHPDTINPCYEEQLDARYDMDKRVVCPPATPGAARPSSPRL